MEASRALAAAFFALALLFINCSSAAQLGQSCMRHSNCDPGLYCKTCLADIKLGPRCTRIQPSNPISKVKGLPFNRYSWLTTHIGKPTVTFQNQQNSITSQLKNGVRGLMLDMYDFRNDTWLCRSFTFTKTCSKFTASQPAINVLQEIRAFLEGNPSEIVTIFIEDHVLSPKGLSRVFDSAGLRKYWFPVTRMPKTGGDWPTVDDMIEKNQRLLVFTSNPDKEASEGIGYQWRYAVENQYGTRGIRTGLCPNRAESSPMDTKTRSLVLMNYFPKKPALVRACNRNSGSLMSIVKACYESSGQRWPNFIAVNFYKGSNIGRASEATDVANGHLVCGCGNIAQCKANMSLGACDLSKPGMNSSLASETNSANPDRTPVRWMWLLLLLGTALVAPILQQQSL